MTGSTVAIIPARGGSKSVPRKNVRLLGGKPLIAWSIEVALAVPEVDRVIVSSDDPEILETARAHGAEAYPRPEHLATDTAVVLDAVRDLLGTLASEGRPAGAVVLLEPTCPFRSAQDVSDCLRLLEDGTVDSVATFVPARLNPHRAWRVEDGRPRTFLPDVDPWQPRQRLPDAYQLNGGVYAFRAGRLPETGAAVLFGSSKAVIVPPERSVDIDDALDFAMAEAMLAYRENQ